MFYQIRWIEQLRLTNSPFLCSWVDLSQQTRHPSREYAKKRSATHPSWVRCPQSRLITDSFLFNCRLRQQSVCGSVFSLKSSLSGFGTHPERIASCWFGGGFTNSGSSSITSLGAGTILLKGFQWLLLQSPFDAICWKSYKNLIKFLSIHTWQDMSTWLPPDLKPTKVDRLYHRETKHRRQ